MRKLQLTYFTLVILNCVKGIRVNEILYWPSRWYGPSIALQ